MNCRVKRIRVGSVVVALLTTGCVTDTPDSALQVNLRLSPTPALVGATRLIIDVADSQGIPLAGARVTVEGVPEEPSRRTALMETAQEEGPGRYVVPGYDLHIRGPWTIAVTVTDSTSAPLTRSFPISVYGEP